MSNISPRHPSQPTLSHFHGLWSLWDMLTLDAKNFIILLHSIYNWELKTRGKTGPIPPVMAQSLPAFRDELIGAMKALDLEHSIKTADNLLSTANSAERLHSAFENIGNSVMLELEGRKFYGPLRRYEQYYEKPKLFGDDVFDHFPSANNDIFEAGTCLALERGTACVLHLMRVAEVGLKTLASKMGVGRQNDWGSYLREIDKELETRLKTAGKRTPDEQFYAEARVTFDGVRMAWRNSTMHVENNYSPERAEEILIAVRALMRHLATKLSETP